MSIGFGQGLSALSKLGGAGGMLGADFGAKLTDKISDIVDRIAQEIQGQNGPAQQVESRPAGDSANQRTDGANGASGADRGSSSTQQASHLPQTISGNKTLGDAAKESGATPEQLMNGLRNGDITIADSGGSAGAE